MFTTSSGLSRLEARFYGEPSKVQKILARGVEGPVPSEEAEQLGIATIAADDIDFEDELRIAIEERASLSPDALTGMEASLRFVGPETIETKIFGRLSAWQNWIFTRANSTGEHGALTLYGTTGTPAVPVEEDLVMTRRDHRRQDSEQRRPVGRRASAARARSVAAEVHRLVEGDGPGRLDGARHLSAHRGLRRDRRLGALRLREDAGLSLGHLPRAEAGRSRPRLR